MVYGRGLESSDALKQCPGATTRWQNCQEMEEQQEIKPERGKKTMIAGPRH